LNGAEPEDALVVARNVAAFLSIAVSSVIVVAGPGTVQAQGSLPLPPPPARTNSTTPSPTPLARSKPAQPAPKEAVDDPARSPSHAWPSDPVAQTKAIQLLLRDLGLYTNTTNGTLGPATRAAIRAFQRGNGDPETGEPSEKLFDDLQKKRPR